MDYKDINDYEILYMINEDKDGSYDILYRKYLPIIKSIASKYVLLVSQVGGEYQDLIQEGFLGLNNAIVSYYDSMNTLFLYLCDYMHTEADLYLLSKSFL